MYILACLCEFCRLICFFSVGDFFTGFWVFIYSCVDNVLFHSSKFSLEDIRISAPDKLCVDMFLF